MPRDILAATPAHRALLRQLFELYAHDFSEMTGGDIGFDGHFTPDDFLKDWWNAAGSFHPFLLRVDGHWAGFAFVQVGSYIAPGRNAHWLMDEFFILRAYRRKGLGAWFAAELFKRFPGTWEVGQIAENTAATAFWRKLLNDVAPGQFEEIAVNNSEWQGVVQIAQIEPQGG